MSSPPPPPSVDEPQLSELPIRDIPGDYGRPFFGPIKDRLDYFYNQGQDEFFKSRMLKYDSTVFRANMPPGPFVASNPNVIIILDAVSFSVLFDTSKVEKKNLLDGTYMPSTSFTGGYRTCAYLDPSEPKHTKLKQLFMSTLSSLHSHFIPQFRTSLASHFFNDLEDQVLRQNTKANFNTLSDNMAFDFVFRLFFDKNPTDTKIGSNGPKIVTKWLALQLAPLITLGLPKIFNYVEDLILHTFPLPFFLVKSDYKKLYDVAYSSSTTILDEAEKFGIGRDEACHNLVFMVGFNAYGGMKTLFPNLMKWVGLGGEKLHKQLVGEIRRVVKSEGGEITLSDIEKMKLTKSVVYEALRIEPPVPFQYAKAKKDMIIESHDAAFQVKEGETIFGYQPFAMRDPKVFESPGEFVANRFLGEEGEKLLKYVYWSNGCETDHPTVDNKQCPGKDLVVLLSRLFLIEFFLRYDTFTVEVGKLLLGSSVKITSLTPKLS